jgi:N-acetylglucosaminyl-diphospho-decaprenol L-rhamnosyltransferase
MTGRGTVVAVVSWNARDLLARCLRSLKRDSDEGLAEVWVIDNASTDGSPDLVRSDFPWVNLVESGGDLGFVAAVNVVARRTKGEWLVPANEDIEVMPGAIRRLIEAGEKHPDGALFAPKLLNPDGTTQLSTGRFPSLTQTAVANLGLHRVSARVAKRFMLEPREEDIDSGPIDFAIGAFLLVRRAAFESIGGFDERYWPFQEDLDLAWRLSRVGWKAWYVADAEVRHVGSGTLRDSTAERERTEYVLRTRRTWLLARKGVGAAIGYLVLNIFGAILRLPAVEALALVAPHRWRRRRDNERVWLLANARTLFVRRPSSL